MRKFEKVSFEQFKKDIVDDEKLYLNYSLPKKVLKEVLVMISHRLKKKLLNLDVLKYLKQELKHV